MKRQLYGSTALALMLIGNSASAQSGSAPSATVMKSGTADAAAGAVPLTATPQAGGAAAPGQLEEIVVTARKFSENNQRAPASIVAVSGSELLQRGISDPQALEKFLPSASLRRQGAVTEVFIRGIGTRIDLPNFAAASAFVYNGIVIQRYGTFGLTFDLDSVQSIAGPQGTLYGGSAAGGAINLFSARPRQDDAGYGALELGTYGAILGSIAQNLAVSDDLTLRGAFNYNRRNSYFHNGINSQDDYSGRLSLTYKPTSDISAFVFYNHGSDNGRPPAIATPAPFPDSKHPYRFPVTGVAGNPLNGASTRQNNDSDIIGANIDVNVGDNLFTYIPAYVRFKADYTYFSGLVGMTGRPGNQFSIYDRESQHSQELRWNRRFGRLQMNAGLFFLHDRIDFNDALLVYTAPQQFVTRVLNRTAQTNLSYAAYAQGIYSLTDKLRVTVGGRVSRDEIDASGVGANGVPIDFHHDQTRADYKVGVDYDIAPSVLIYGNVQTGYIPFGYNPDVSPNALVGQSRLFALSGGVKSRFLDNRVELNVEGFHYDYDNFQAIAFIAATGLSTVLNARKAKIYGVDVSLRAQITPTTRVNAGVVVERARYTDFEGVGYDYSGNRIINAPPVNVNAGIQQSIALGRHGELLARVDSHYSGSYYGNFNNFRNTRQSRYVKSDASLTYTAPSQKWSVQGFVRNLEDKAVYTTLSPGATSTAPAVGGLEAPRTFGARVQLNW